MDRYDRDLKALCARTGAHFLDTALFLDEAAGDAFADGFTLIPTAHDRWVDLVRQAM